MLGFCHIMGRAILDLNFRNRILAKYQDWGDLHQDLAKDFAVSRYDTNEIHRIFSLDIQTPQQTPGEPFVKTIDGMNNIKNMVDLNGADVNGHFYSFFCLTIMDTSIYEWLVAGASNDNFQDTYVKKFNLSSQMNWFKDFTSQKGDSGKAQLLKAHINAFQVYRWTITLQPGADRTRCTLSHTYAADYEPFDSGALIREHRKRKNKTGLGTPTSGRQSTP